MSKFTNYLIILSILYSCSPVNKQHGYLIDDMLISSEKISKFKVNNTTTDEVYLAMGSPSIEINDVDNVWIYLLSLKEKKIFEEDTLLYQNIYRFVFNDKEILTDMSVLSEENIVDSFSQARKHALFGTSNLDRSAEMIAWRQSSQNFL